MHMQKILSLLKREDLAFLGIDLASVRKAGFAGFNSKVYMAKSRFGNLVIHLTAPCAEHLRQETQKKIPVVAEFLRSNGFLLAPKVFFSSAVEKYFLIVQEMVPGKPLGKRVISGKAIKDVYGKNSDCLVDDVQKVLKGLHSLKPQGFGVLRNKGGALHGDYISWHDFVRTESRNWLDRLFLGYNQKESFMSGREYIRLQEMIGRIVEKNKALLVRQESRFIHGDMINPGNIIVKDCKISGIIDYEWSMGGDSAWEFGFTTQFPKKSYFKGFRKHEIVDFQQRKKIYAILWRLWGCSVHVMGNKIKDILWKEFLDLLERYDID